MLGYIFSDPAHTLEVSIGTKIKALRLKAGMTQVQLAQAAGIFQPMLARYEMGKGLPAGTRLVAIAKALGTTVEEIIDESALPPTTDSKSHVHGNSLAAKIQDIFLELRPEEQRVIYHQAEALLQRRKSTDRPKRTAKATDTPKRPRKAA